MTRPPTVVGGDNEEDHTRNLFLNNLYNRQSAPPGVLTSGTFSGATGATSVELKVNPWQSALSTKFADSRPEGATAGQGVDWTDDFHLVPVEE